MTLIGIVILISVAIFLQLAASAPDVDDNEMAVKEGK